MLPDDRKTYQVDYFNLDADPFGRVPSQFQRGTQFRIWATRTCTAIS